MLITYLKEAYPDILTNPPNISDLTLIYKESKKRFDADEQFKETSRLNVVNLQVNWLNCIEMLLILHTIDNLYRAVRKDAEKFGICCAIFLEKSSKESTMLLELL